MSSDFLGTIDSYVYRSALDDGVVEHASPQ